ncbi:hypothetical protein OnM2_049034 [Erysiphe neolycopersici]|uniref:Uncharacterized protein n=1 Tax=Erysiphe neolycopersici TaxID=212602 RepID=A0A420HT08_9PEZI|nr:hypothetical protein OnM2_049034 [Erysiphe neolycopersici]
MPQSVIFVTGGKKPDIGADIGFPEIDVPRAAGPLIGEESLIGDDPVIHSSPQDFVEYRPLFERLRRLRLEDDNSEDETGQPFDAADEGRLTVAKDSLRSVADRGIEYAGLGIGDEIFEAFEVVDEDPELTKGQKG